MQNQKSEYLPKISVIIPSYNKVKFIGLTLASIFEQNYKNIEVIVQDGGSTDGTVDIIKKYASRYPGLLKYESKKDKGQLDAINNGMSKARGEIFTFINADDCYSNGAFNKIANAYMENPDSIWFAGQGVVINDAGWEIAKPVTWYKNLLLNHATYYLLLTTNFLMQPSVFFTKDVFKKYGPFTGTSDFIMEYDFWLKLGKIQMPVVINNNLSCFRIEPTTKTKRLFNDLLKEDEQTVKKYTSNLFILLLHKLHNEGRKIIGRWV